jgi:hypothetical protein
MELLRRSTNGAAAYRIQGSSSFIVSLHRLHKGSNPGHAWVFFMSSRDRRKAIDED